MMKINIIKQIQKLYDENRLISRVNKFCSINTVNPPGNEYLMNDVLVKAMEEIGCCDIDLYEKEKGRSNIVGRIKGNTPGRIAAIVGHSDVVAVSGQKWQYDPFKPITKHGKIYARGAVDNKGPFAAVLEGVRIFNTITKGNFPGEIMIISAADEEAGSKLGVKYLFEEIGLVCDYALIPDGGDFKHAIYGEMGILQLEFEALGKAYHGSMPELGVNAIAPVAEMYLALYQKNWADLEGDGEFENAVLNLGLITGGTAANIVPEIAGFNAMWRYPLSKKEHDKTISAKILEIVKVLVCQTEQRYPEVKLTYKVIHQSNPYIGNKTGKLFSCALQSASDLDLAVPTLKTIRAETVGKYINQACRAEVLVNGPMDGSVGIMHQPDEYVDIGCLGDFAKYYALLLYNLYF